MLCFVESDEASASPKTSLLWKGDFTVSTGTIIFLAILSDL